ncbi:MAG: ferredoxin [Paracoccaceae bacterium]
MTRPGRGLDDVRAALAAEGLALTGAFHPGADDRAPEGAGTLALAGPADGAMWAAFAASPEAADGRPDPLDRWSRRVLDVVAAALDARALYPFGGPPYQPFMHWAMRAEGLAASPIGLGVTPARGLLASWRGALAFAERLDLGAPSSPGPSPCTGCAAPCTRACPVDAFAGGRYDVDACLGHLARPEGAACRSLGCLARRACPANAALPAAQAAFHLVSFRNARSA